MPRVANATSLIGTADGFRHDSGSQSTGVDLRELRTEKEDLRRVIDPDQDDDERPAAPYAEATAVRPR